MKAFFQVTELEAVLRRTVDFAPTGSEPVSLTAAAGRILAADVVADVDLPEFARSTMDGYAVAAASTFGASEANPAYLTVKGAVAMGQAPDFAISAGQAAKIATGGMLPAGSDSVVMVEHTEVIDDTTIEVFRSVAPGQNVLEKGEDLRRNECLLSRGRRLRAQEIGLLAALGRQSVPVYRQPVIGIISTGDEVVPIEAHPGPGQIRDINSYTLATLVRDAGAVPEAYGIVRDSFEDLFAACRTALDRSDMVLISGGSSVGVRDFTIEALAALPEAAILVHGIAISPGKPTILARSGRRALWGLPGHVVSAMVVFEIVVRPFIEHVSGRVTFQSSRFRLPALLSRNLSSVQGRADFVRVRLTTRDGRLWAEPILGKSGLIHTMVKADGLIAIGTNTEGLDQGTVVDVMPL